jgi:hypothetical protein
MIFKHSGLTVLLIFAFSGLLLTRGPAEPVRGIIVSCQTWGWDWGSDAMVEALHNVTKVGSNWVAIHPYARIDRAGTVTCRRAAGS